MVACREQTSPRSYIPVTSPNVQADINDAFIPLKPTPLPPATAKNVTPGVLNCGTMGAGSVLSTLVASEGHSRRARHSQRTQSCRFTTATAGVSPSATEVGAVIHGKHDSTSLGADRWANVCPKCHVTESGEHTSHGLVARRVLKATALCPKAASQRQRRGPGWDHEALPIFELWRGLQVFVGG